MKTGISFLQKLLDCHSEKIYGTLLYEACFYIKYLYLIMFINALIFSWYKDFKNNFVVNQVSKIKSD